MCTSDDAWEKWEFGNESFIDKAMLEASPEDVLEEGETEATIAVGASSECTTRYPSPHPGNVPLKDGEPRYSDAILALRPFISDERREKMEVCFDAS